MHCLDIFLLILMAEKKIILVSPVTTAVTTRKVIQWDKCYLCQKSTKEKLSCPAAYAETQPAIKANYNAEQEYYKIAHSIKEFHKMGCMPVILDVIALDEGEGIARTLLLRRASHHCKCQMKFKPVRLEQAKKRSLDKGEMADEENEASKKRFSRQGITSNVGRCYFCGEKNR